MIYFTKFPHLFVRWPFDSMFIGELEYFAQDPQVQVTAIQERVTNMRASFMRDEANTVTMSGADMQHHQEITAAGNCLQRGSLTQAYGLRVLRIIIRMI